MGPSYNERLSAASIGQKGVSPPVGEWIIVSVTLIRSQVAQLKSQRRRLPPGKRVEISMTTSDLLSSSVLAHPKASNWGSLVVSLLYTTFTNLPFNSIQSAIQCGLKLLTFFGSGDMI
jgi:hypothetical protein